MILKPGLRIPDSLFTREVPKKTVNAEVTCRCGAGVGYELPHGPRGTSFSAVASNRVQLFKITLPRKAMWKEVHYKAPYTSIEGRDRDSFFSGARAPPAPDLCVDTASVLRVHQQAAAVLSDFQEDPEVVQGPMQRAASDGSDRQVDLVRINGMGPALVTALYDGSLDKGYLPLQLHDRVDVSYVGESEEDSGWSYGKSCASGDMGWFLSANAATDIRVCASGASTPSTRSTSGSARRGRSATRHHTQGPTQDEFEDWRRLAIFLRQLIDRITQAESDENWESVWAALESASQLSMPTCEFWCVDVHDIVLAKLHALRDTWLSQVYEQWWIALSHVKDMLRSRLNVPDAVEYVPIQKIRYTQSQASDSFRSGLHAGQRVEDVAQDIIAGRLRPTDESMTLDVIHYHGSYWSLNNRHLHALNLFVREVWPEWKRIEEVARIRVWPLTPGLRLHGRCVCEKFLDACSTRDGGRSLSLSTSRSPSLSRRVRFQSQTR